MDEVRIDKIKYPNCIKGHQYALDIISKKITASKYTIGACKRYVKDLANKEADFFMDWDAAEKYLRLVQKFNHVIGKWPTKNIVYEPWQCFIWMNIIGFKNKDDKNPRFRIAHVEVARGNAKSAMASQAVLYFLALDDPSGNQISTVATKKDQARIVLDSARAMAKDNTSYLQKTGVKVLEHKIKHAASNSEARALSSEKKGLDGLNDVLAVCDELHAMDRDVFELITSGMSKRRDSITLCITTAGADVTSVGHSQSAYAKKVCLGEVLDDTMFACVYTLDEKDYWADERVWIKANPNWGISVDPKSFKSKIQKALITPADVHNIRIKHLNEWLSEANAFFSTSDWDECFDPNLKIENMKGKSCRLALDMASHIDLAGWVQVFKEEGEEDGQEIYSIFDKTYLPEKTVREEKNAFYDDCIAKGWLIETKGAAINFGDIRKDIIKFTEEFPTIECMYDPWNTIEMAENLSNKVEMTKIHMNVANLSEPMKKFRSAMREKRIRHCGSPLLRWCVGNVVAQEDHNSNVFPRKAHNRLKIDPVVGIIMAIAGHIQEPNEESVYEKRGIRTL